jgi:hypothetical protein
MAQESIALHRRLTSKFVAMALLFFLAPQVFLYFFASNTASDVLIESLSSPLTKSALDAGGLV